MKNTIYIIIVLLLSIDICKAQPINDNCPGTTLSSTTICTTTAGTLAAGTFSGSAASCGGLPNHDVFYNFIATNTAHRITVTVCSTMDAVVQVYSGSCGGTSIGCFNSGGIGVFEICNLTGLTIGTTYWIRVYDFYGIASCSTFDICVSLPPSPTLIAAAASTPLSCSGSCDGTAVGSWIGGYGPYSQHWSGPSSFTSDSLSITGLCSGTYIFSVLDSFDMTSTYSTVIVYQSTPPFSIHASSDTTLCSPGSVPLNVNLTGGTTSGACALNTGSTCFGNYDTVGTGFVSNSQFSFPSPFANYYTSVSQQFLYTATELHAAGITAGQINEIDFLVISVPSGCITTFNQYTVQMGCTNSISLTTTPITGLVTVFPSQPFSIHLGWNTITFPFGYTWDGTSNLVIQICNNEGPPYPNWTSNVLCAYTSTSYMSSNFSVSDATNLCGGGLSITSSTNTYHPNIAFRHCPSTITNNALTYLWTPTSGNIANDTAQHTTAMPTVTTPYVVTVTDTTTGCYKKDTVNVTVNSCTVGVNPEPISSNSITIFPNPSNGDFKVECTNSKITGIKVYNLLGECIYTTTNTQGKLTGSAGVYIIEIITTNGTFRKKIIKE
jgi:hypothetical protein